MGQIISPGSLIPAQRGAGLAVPSQFRKVMDAGGGNAFNAFTNDAAVSGGMAFLTSELAKRDTKLREPLTSITYPRDIYIERGGGWVDFTEVEFVDYAISGPNQYGLSGNKTTQIPIVSANLSKDIYRVFNFENVMEVSYIDLQKANTIGRSLDNLLDNGIKLNWEKAMDLITYQGWVGYPGLTNNPNVAAASVPVGASGFTQWSTKTPDEILADIDSLQLSTWIASEFDLSGMANHILIPPLEFATANRTKVSSAGNVSILTYLRENNIGKSQGVDLTIAPSRWMTGAGSGGTDRMMGYVNNKDKVYLDVTVPLTRVMTMPTVTNGVSYLTAFAGQIGVVKFLYNQTAVYADGI